MVLSMFSYFSSDVLYNELCGFIQGQEDESEQPATVIYFNTTAPARLALVCTYNLKELQEQGCCRECMSVSYVFPKVSYSGSVSHVWLCSE